MGWFLRRKKFCVSAALIALLIQFVASFEHFHLERIGLRSDQTQLIGESGSAAGGAGESTGYICNVCATLSLAASARIAIPPELPVRFAFNVVASIASVETIPAPSLRVAFRSRAPPLA
jgi:hypothetical protein